MHVPTHLPHVKLKKMECTCIVAHNFSMYTIANEHMRHMSDECNELVLGLPHYMWCTGGVDTYRQ